MQKPATQSTAKCRQCKGKGEVQLKNKTKRCPACQGSGKAGYRIKS